MKQFLFVLVASCAILACDKHTPQVPHTELSKDSLLVGSLWQIQHIQALQNNTVFFYERGGQNNTYNYDHDFLKFEPNGTGSYQAGNDVYDIEWHFDNADKTELSYTVHDYANGLPHAGLNHDVKLENVVLVENSFRYAEVYTNENGTHTISSVYREPSTFVK